MRTIFAALALLAATSAHAAVVLDEPHFKFADDKLNYVGTMKNVGPGRAIGGVCIRLYDKDGFEVESGSMSNSNMGVGDTDTETGYVYIKVGAMREVATMKLYFATARCADSPSEAMSSIVSVNVHQSK